jgi:hypothetical protein
MAPGDELSSSAPMLPEPKLTNTKWSGLGLTRQARYHTLFTSREFQSVFDAKFFDRAEDRLYDLEKRNYAATGLQLTIMTILVVSLIHLNLKVSFLGITSDDVGGAKEVLVLISAAIGIYETNLNLRINNLKEMLTARAVILAGESEDAKNVLLLSYGLGSYWDPAPVDKFLEPSKLKKTLRILTNVLAYLFLCFILIAFLTIHIMILVDISRNPSISVGVSAAVVCIVVALDLIGLPNSYIRVGAFPFKNNWFKNELFLKYPDIYEMNIKAA